MRSGRRTGPPGNLFTPGRDLRRVHDESAQPQRKAYWAGDHHGAEAYWAGATGVPTTDDQVRIWLLRFSRRPGTMPGGAWEAYWADEAQ